MLQDVEPSADEAEFTRGHRRGGVAANGYFAAHFDIETAPTDEDARRRADDDVEKVVAASRPRTIADGGAHGREPCASEGFHDAG